MKNVFHVFSRMFTKFLGERPSRLAVFLCMALFASTTAFAEEYITDVMVIGGDKDRVDFLKDSCGAQGWTVIDKDLNDNAGVGTDYVYLLYKKSSEGKASNGFITDFIIKTDEYPDSYIFNGRTYYRIPHKGSEHFEIHGGNLNSGTVSSSTNMRLYYTKEEFPDRRFVRDIAFTDAKLKSGYTTLGRNGAVVGSDGSGAMDLNEGAGSSSDYIYMHFATVSSSMDTPEYISDVVVLGGSKDEVNALKERYASRGWIVIDQDLNDNAGAGTDYIYMAYKKSHFSDVNKGFITDFIIKTGDHPDSFTFNGRTYYRASNFGDGNFAIYGGNLNSGTVSSSTNMWLYFTRESFPDKRVVSNIAFTSGKANKTKEGYTTLGENGAVVGNDGSGAMDLNEGAGSSSDYIYMHFATAPKVDITFVTGDENVSVPTQTIVFGSTPIKPSDPERAGLKFKGWFADDAFSTEFVFSSPVTSNISVYAKWEASVAFVSGVENVSVPSQTVVLGNTPTKPSDPKRTGFTFIGWYTSADGNTLFDFSTPVTSDITVYARWWNGDLSTLANNGSYVAEDGYVLRGELASLSKISIADGATVTLKDVTIDGVSDKNDTYEWAGITCLGDCKIILEGSNNVKGFWEDYPGIHVPEGKTLTIEGGENDTLYASSNGWGAGLGGGFAIGCGNIEIKSGTVVATGGNHAAGIGGGDGNIVGDITITDGVTLVTATKGNYSPNSIGLGSRGTSVGTITIGGVVVADGIPESSFTYPSSDLYTYTVVFRANGGEGLMPEQKIFLGYSSPLSANAFTKNGYSFVGWNTDPEGHGTGYADGASVLNLATQVGATVILYAQWIKDDGNVINLKELTKDSVVQDGYLLTGKLGGNYKVSIADGATVTLIGATIIALGDGAYKWAGITCEGDCKIILKGVNAVKGFSSHYPGIYVPKGKTLTIEGDGSLEARGNTWAAGIGAGYEDDDCGNIVISGGSVTATGGRYAAGIGSGYYSATVGDITITDGVTLVTATKGEDSPNSIGLGYLGKSVGTITIGGVNTGNVSTNPFIYQPYSVVFNANGGSGFMDRQHFSFGGDPVALSKNTFTREGYTFVGWNTRADGEGLAYSNREKVQDLVSVPGAVITLYAQWNKTVQSMASIVISQDGNGKLHATIDGDYAGTDIVSIDDENGIVVDNVVLDRTLSTIGYATITLPFGIDSAKVKGAKQFLKFVGVILNEETKLREVHFERAWCDLPALLEDIDNQKDLSDEEKKEKKEKVSAKCNVAPKKLFAYTPYVVQMKDESLSFDDGVTLVKTPAAAETVVNNWVLRGTLAPKVWEEGDPEIGNAYGYVAGTGEFRKVGDNSSIGALRSYLVYEKQSSGTQSSANNSGASQIRANFSTEFLPANMDVVIVDDDENDNEHRTVIGKFNTRTGEFKFTMPESGTFDVKGRRVNETRSVGKGRKAKGVYYGRKR